MYPCAHASMRPINPPPPKVAIKAVFGEKKMTSAAGTLLPDSGGGGGDGDLDDDGQDKREKMVHLEALLMSLLSTGVWRGVVRGCERRGMDTIVYVGFGCGLSVGCGLRAES